MAHPHLPPPSPSMHHLLAHFSLTADISHYFSWWDDKFACPCPFCPPCLANSPQDEVLQTQRFPQQALHLITLKNALLTRMSTLPSCNISFHSCISPVPAYLWFYKWIAISWDTGSFRFVPEEAAVVRSLLRALMPQWYHYYKKYIFILKLLLSKSISSLRVFLVYEYF